jgi:hypothetical protein
MLISQVILLLLSFLCNNKLSFTKDFYMFAYVFIALTFVSFTASADDDILNVDRSVSKSIQLAFSNDNNITPKKSDFEVVNYVLMSNENGERWGVLTLTNLSHGERSINQEHLLALFADGSRSAPLAFTSNFTGKETQSLTLSFGENKFPILSIYSSNNL